jgi:hypothetical protein
MRAPWAGRTELRTLAGGLLVVAVAALLAGAGRADRVAASNEVLLQSPVATLTAGSAACQPDSVPPDASRVRVPATVEDGALRARAVVAVDGRRAAGDWAAAKQGEIVVPLPAGTPEGPVEICIESAGPGQGEIMGARTGEADRLRLGEGTGAGRMRLDYLFGPGPQAFWGAASAALPSRIAAANGSAWAPWLVGIGLLAALGGLVALVAAPAGRREVLAVAVLALGSGMSWAGVTPLFQATDELAHAAYVQALAELGHPPRQKKNTGEVSAEMACWADFVRLEKARFYHPEHPPWRRHAGDPCAGMDRRKDAAQYQAVQPPAYYAMASAGYRVGNVLDRPLPDRLLLTRLVSVLLAAVTVLSVFLLVREVLPASPWPARAAALAVGLQPVLMFNVSFINSDALVVATTAVIAAVLARTWRRGPTLPHGLLVGGLLALGALSKINFLLLVPCVVAVQAVAVLRWSALPLRRRGLLLAASWATALVPVLAYLSLGESIWESEVQDQAGVAPPVHVSKTDMASFVWQSFLPPLPFMDDRFPGIRPPALEGMLFGPTSRLGWWNDYGIGEPWRTLLVLACVALVARAVLLAARRRAWRLPLFVAATVALTFTALLVAALYDPSRFQVQGRYLLPLAPIWALAVGVAASGVQARLQRHAVALLGVAMLGWTGLAFAATVSRWYL